MQRMLLVTYVWTGFQGPVAERKLFARKPIAMRWINAAEAAGEIEHAHIEWVPMADDNGKTFAERRRENHAA